MWKPHRASFPYSLFPAPCSLVLVIGVALLLTGEAHAQFPRATVYTDPGVPSADALKRLNLVVVWGRRIPTEGRRDGLATIQRAGKDYVVQTRSGLVVLLDAETGAVRWAQRVGIPYRVGRAAAFNSRAIYVLNNAYLYSLDRATGAEQWRLEVPAGVTTMPLADNEQVYLATAIGRIYAYYLPREAGAEVRTDIVLGRRDVEFPRPRLTWQEQTNIQLDIPPIHSADQMIVVSPQGEVQVLNKFPRENESSALVFTLKLDGGVSARPGRYADTAYIGSLDSNVYALQMRTGRLQWRHTAGSAIIREPAAVENDVYVTSQRGGLARLDRGNGEGKWQVPFAGRILESNREADRFLATNNRFVYAFDRSGRLMVLDHKRGTTQGLLDLREFNIPVPNTDTDRLYLAANNGLIVCLRDREQAAPVRHRDAEEKIVNPLQKRLRDPVSTVGGKVPRLRDLVEQLSKEWKVKMLISDRAFKAEKAEDRLNKPVTVPRIDNQPLGKALQLILNQLPATFEPLEDSLLIVPGAARRED